MDPRTQSYLVYGPHTIVRLLSLTKAFQPCYRDLAHLNCNPTNELNQYLYKIQSDLAIVTICTVTASGAIMDPTLGLNQLYFLRRLEHASWTITSYRSQRLGRVSAVTERSDP